MTRWTLCAAPARALALAVALLGSAAQAQPPAAQDDAAAVEKIIWAKEMAIYAGRAKGDVSYYANNASPHYLAWTAGTPAPFGIDRLNAGKVAMKGKDKEIITTELRGFSLSGDTAIIYYENHRTRMPDGTAVDQNYDNIHVWQKTNGEWLVLASMSRPMMVKPTAPAAAPAPAK